jgi:hypothetical protein
MGDTPNGKRGALERTRRRVRTWTVAIAFLLGSVSGAGLASLALRLPAVGPGDAVPPSVEQIELGGGSPLGAGPTEIRIVFSEPLGAPPRVTFDGPMDLAVSNGTLAGASWRGILDVPPGADGTYEMRVQDGRDRGGNPMEPFGASFVVDTVPPAAFASAETARATSPFHVLWDAGDDGSGIVRVDLWSRIGGEPWTLLATSSADRGTFLYAPPVDEGLFSFCASAVDRAGNRGDPCPAQAIVDFDATPPSASLLPLPYWATGPTELAAVDGGDAAEIELRFFFSTDNATWQGPFSGGNATGPFAWTFPFPLGPGHYRLAGRARDGKGWLEPDQPPSAAELLLGLDGEAPASRLGPATPYWQAGSIVVEASASDAGSGVAVVDLFSAHRTNATAPWSPWTLTTTRAQPPWTFTFDFPQGDGRYELASRATDRAGRREALPPIGQGDLGLGFDREAPEAPLLSVPLFVDPAARTTNVTWSDDPAPDVIRYEVHRGTTPGFVLDESPCPVSATCVAETTRTGRTAWAGLLAENATSFFRIRAVDDGGLASESATVGAIFHGSGFDTPNTYPSAIPLLLGTAWAERLQFASVCGDCVDAFKVTLAAGQTLNLSLAVPPTGDFRILVLNAAGTTVARSERVGLGVWESVAYVAPAAATYYVLVDWSNVFGPGNRNEGWYTLAATVL